MVNNDLYRGLGLAPMVRASTIPLRILALEYGADFVYTEDLVDRSISQTIRVENKHLQTIDYVKDPSTLSKKTRRKLEAQNNRPCLILRIDPKLEKNKLICQIGSGEEYSALKAATLGIAIDTCRISYIVFRAVSTTSTTSPMCTNQSALPSA